MSEAAGSSAEWTCSRCAVISRWPAGIEPPELPPNWAREGDRLHCLFCRRELAGEAGDEAAPANATRAERVKLRRSAMLEFEIGRDPERTNGEIARAARCSASAVIKARQRFEG